MKCANVRIRDGHILGDCRKPAYNWCEYCKSWRCSVHAPREYCGACGTKTTKRIPDRLMDIFSFERQ